MRHRSKKMLMVLHHQVRQKQATCEVKDHMTMSRGAAYLVLADVCIADRAASVLHGLLKVGPGDGGHQVRRVLLHAVRVFQLCTLMLNVLLNILTDGVPATSSQQVRVLS